MRAIGLMSGTSMDGIDVALIDCDGEYELTRGPSAEYPFDLETKRKIEQGLIDALKIENDRLARPGRLAALESHITDLHVKAVARFLSKHDIDADTVDVIGFHGQTILHRPENQLTVQLGNGALLASKTGIDTVYDMRAADMENGGQGAPLVPVYHRALSKAFAEGYNPAWPIAFVNIGGISNITFVGGGGELIAFDTGPGNALIDQWVNAKAGIPMDQGGMIGSEGGVVPMLVERYMADSYFVQKLPKSLDRNYFPPLQTHEAELSDGAKTLAHITALSIFAASQHLPEQPKTWIICGGGRKNRTIMRCLHDLAGKTASKVVLAEEAGFNGDTMEAEAFAYLGVRSLKNLPLTFPDTTGCRDECAGGVLARASP